MYTTAENEEADSSPKVVTLNEAYLKIGGFSKLACQSLKEFREVLMAHVDIVRDRLQHRWVPIPHGGLARA